MCIRDRGQRLRAGPRRAKAQRHPAQGAGKRHGPADLHCVHEAIASCMRNLRTTVRGRHRHRPHAKRGKRKRNFPHSAAVSPPERSSAAPQCPGLALFLATAIGCKPRSAQAPMKNCSKTLCATPYTAMPASRRRCPAGVAPTAFALRVYGQCKRCAPSRTLAALAQEAAAQAHPMRCACPMPTPSRTRLP